MSIRRDEQLLEDAAVISQAMDDEREALTHLREQRSIEQKNLERVIQEMNDYRQRTMTEINTKSASEMMRLEHKRKDIKRKEEKLARREATAKESSRNVEFAHRTLLATAKKIKKDREEADRLFSEAKSKHRQAASAYEDSLHITKTMQRDRAALKKDIGKIAATRKEIEQTLKKASRQAAEQAARLSDWEANLSAREKSITVAIGKLEQRKTLLESRESALHSAIVEHRLHGKV